MPVEEHPVHHTVKKTGKELNGCHNRKPFSPGYFAPDRVYKPDGTYHTILRRVHFKNSVLCNYDRWHSDWGCLDCRWAGGQVPSAKEIYKQEEECND